MNLPTKKLDLDWQNIRDRLKHAAETYEETHRLSPERARAILEERARAAARVPALPAKANEVLEVVQFVLGEERYAIDTTCVREILPLKEVTPLPDGPDFLVGITNLRGQVLAILDLRPLFGVPPRASTELSRVIVLGTEQIEFGLLADAVDQVALLRLETIGEAPGSVANSTRAYLRGVTADALLVLDGASVLQDPRLYVDLSEDGGLAHS